MGASTNPRRRRSITAGSALLLGLALAVPAQAVPITVTVTPTASLCDNIPPPAVLHELGNPPAFPAGEAIASSDQATSLIACPAQDTGAANVLVSITNLTSKAYPDVWYVSDPETSISNYDQFLVNGEQAFKIDTVGGNKPLFAESITANGIFEPGETWDFIIDDYSNTLALPASALDSAGLVGAGSGGSPPSSGSIIVPEPATLALLILGLGGVALAGRRR